MSSVTANEAFNTLYSTVGVRAVSQTHVRHWRGCFLNSGGQDSTEERSVLDRIQFCLKKTKTKKKPENR